MATTSAPVQFCVIDGPSLDGILALLATKRPRKPQYFILQEAKYVSDPRHPHSTPKLVPLEDAPEKRVELYGVTCVERPSGSGGLFYNITCYVSFADNLTLIPYNPHNRSGCVSFDKNHPALQRLAQI